MVPDTLHIRLQIGLRLDILALKPEKESLSYAPTVSFSHRVSWQGWNKS